MSENGDGELRDEFVRVDHTVVHMRNGTVHFLEPEEYDTLRRRRNVGKGSLYETTDIFGAKVALSTDMIADVSRETNESLQRRKRFQDRMEEILGDHENPWESH